MVQYEWNQNNWESLSEMEWDANATEVVGDTTKSCSNAVDTLPFGLILKESANSSLSVWTQKLIEKGTKFGPLQGDIISEDNSWKLRTAKRSDLWPVFAPSSPYHVSHYIDTSPLFGSNWMRYVAFPGASCPHNLVACQVENAIYFFARENIPAFTELKVWFHPNFFERMKSSTVHNIPWNVERHPFQNHHNFFELNKFQIRLQSFPLAPSFPQNRLHFLLNHLHDHSSFEKNHLNKFPVNHFQSLQPPSLQTAIPINGFLRSSVDDGFNSKARIHQNIFMHKKEQEERKLVLRSNSYKLDSSNESSPNLIKHENTTPPNSASLESTNSSNYSWSCSEASSKESILLAAEERFIGRKFSGTEETSTSDGSPEKARETRRKSRGVASLPYELPRVNGKTIYECRICKKVCAQLSNLKVHMYTHTGERPYKCSQCPSKFTQKAHLHKHMSTHTGVKPFSCPICGKKSASSSNIKAHMKVHESR